MKYFKNEIKLSIMIYQLKYNTKFSYTNTMHIVILYNYK